MWTQRIVRRNQRKNKIGKPCFGSQPGNAHELEICKRKGVGIDFSEPEGHAGPKSQVRGSVGAIDQARLDEEHVRRLAHWQQWKLAVRRFFQLTILAWNHSPTYVPPLIFPIIP